MFATTDLQLNTSANPETSPVILQALTILLQAYDYASDVGRDPWEFAVEISVFQQAGCTHSDLRWLKCKEFVDHATEITAPVDQRREFQLSPNISFNRNTCFVLTPAGARLTRGQIWKTESRAVGHGLLGQSGIFIGVVPVWDRELHVLRVGDLIVKHFKTPAPNQGAILSAFQEEGWPLRIDDPIPPQIGQDSKTRLHDTINALNRNQKHRLIHFVGDGSGQGIRWELLQDPVTEAGEANGKVLAR
jgi:hypothetical protein